MSKKDCRYDVMVVEDIDKYDIEPIDDYLLIKVDLPKKQTQSGLIVATREHQDESNRKIVGDVLAVGERCQFGIKVGDRVMFNQFSGTVALRKTGTENEEGFEHRLMSEESIICRLKPKCEK